MNIETKITPRLKMTADLVPHCGIVADIGTDHGYLPIYLLKKGICKKVIGADVNPGPLSAAERNAAAAGIGENIELVLSDGLTGIPPVDCTVIAGMGGELIISILKNRKDGQEKFVLQPQRSQDKMRMYLAEEGFEIKKESIAKERGKMYCAVYAVYTGEKRHITGAEALMGKKELIKENPLFEEYVIYRKREITNAVDAIEKAEAIGDRKNELLRIAKIYDDLLKE